MGVWRLPAAPTQDVVPQICRDPLMQGTPVDVFRLGLGHDQSPIHIS